jgi:serine/threonine-protein kinase
MPPEQIITTKEVDHRVDIYATGAVLYELLSGKKPYEEAMRKLQSDPAPLREVKPDLPPWLAAVIMKALAREPDDRYDSAAEMAAALRGNRQA